MKSLVRATLSVSLVLILCACDHAPSEKDSDTDYFPLKLGNTWTYKTSGMDGTKLVVKVVKTEEVDNQPCALVEMRTGQRPQIVSTEHIAVKADGVFRYTDEGKRLNPPICILKLPIKNNDTWRVTRTVDGKIFEGTCKIGGIAAIQIGDAKYTNVITVTTTGFRFGAANVTYTKYYARGVGEIRSTSSMEGLEMITDLENFEPGK
jgi:hypothetical protein